MRWFQLILAIVMAAGVANAQRGFYVENQGAGVTKHNILNAEAPLQIISSGEENAIQIQSNSIGTTHIGPSGVDTSELADNAVTNLKMADDAVGLAELAGCSGPTQIVEYGASGVPSCITTPSGGGAGGGLSGQSMAFWAEESGQLNVATNSGFQYSYGNGNVNSGGIEMPGDGEITFITVDCEDMPTTANTVVIAINRTNSACAVDTLAGAGNDFQSNSAACTAAFVDGDQLTPRTTASPATDGDGCTVMWIVEFD